MHALLGSGVWNRPDLIAVISLLVSCIAFCLAIITLRRANRNASVASMIPLNAEIREMWEDYLGAFPEAELLRDSTLTDLNGFEESLASKLERMMNVLEIAAAIEVEGTFSGVSRVLMKDYLERMLQLVISDKYTSNKASELLQDDNTFVYIRRFLKSRASLSVTLPPGWYAYPTVTLRDRFTTFFGL